MEVFQVSEFGVKPCPAEDLRDLLLRPDVLIWVDIPLCDGQDAEVLSEVFGFHRIAVHDCVERNHVSKIHVYPDHVFTVLHAPQIGTAWSRPLRRAGPVPRPQLPGHRARAAEPGGRPRGRVPGHRRRPAPDRERNLQPALTVRAVLCDHVSLTRREIDLIASLAKESGRTGTAGHAG